MVITYLDNPQATTKVPVNSSSAPKSRITYLDQGQPKEAPKSPMFGAIETAAAGPMGMGSREPGQVLAQAVDTAFGGTPRNILRYPETFAFGGVPAVNSEQGASGAVDSVKRAAMFGPGQIFSGKPTIPTSGAESLLPEPQGITGQAAGDILGATAVGGLSNIKSATPTIGQQFGADLAKVQPQVDLARSFGEHAQGAVDVSGEMLHGAIRSNADQAVDLTRAQKVIDNLPPKVQFKIFSDPEVSRVGDMVSPTLGNMETIRGHILDHMNTVDFMSKAPLQQAYNEVGHIMREAAPETQPLFEDYAKSKGAQERLTGRLTTPQGQDNPEPLAKMFGEGQVANKQALMQLAQNEPRLLDVAEQVKEFGDAKIRARNAKATAIRAGRAAAEGVGLGGIVKLFGR